MKNNKKELVVIYVSKEQKDATEKRMLHFTYGQSTAASG